MAEAAGMACTMESAAAAPEYPRKILDYMEGFLVSKVTCTNENFQNFFVFFQDTLWVFYLFIGGRQEMKCKGVGGGGERHAEMSESAVSGS